MPLKLLNWNVEWAEPKWKAHELQRRIAQHAADVICLTETDTARLALPPDGHSICPQDNWGQPFRQGQEGRRKVLLWSRAPWQAVDDVGHASLPPGRFVSGVTQTDVGEVTVIGVCIPWSRSRVGPRSNRETWQDHEEYLDGLAGLLKRAPKSRLVVVGDFNQRIGQRSSTPLRLRAALQSALGPNLSIATAGLGFQGRRTIDHIALEPGPGRRLPRRHQQPPPGRRPVGPFRRCCPPFRSGHVTEDPGQERMDHRRHRHQHDQTAGVRRPSRVQPDSGCAVGSLMGTVPSYGFGSCYREPGGNRDG